MEKLTWDDGEVEWVEPGDGPIIEELVEEEKE